MIFFIIKLNFSIFIWKRNILFRCISFFRLSLIYYFRSFFATELSPYKYILIFNYKLYMENIFKIFYTYIFFNICLKTIYIIYKVTIFHINSFISSTRHIFNRIFNRTFDTEIRLLQLIRLQEETESLDPLDEGIIIVLTVSWGSREQFPVSYSRQLSLSHLHITLGTVHWYVETRTDNVSF